MRVDKMVAMVPECAREIERLRFEAGLSADELLIGLCEQRKRYDTCLSSTSKSLFENNVHG